MYLTALVIIVIIVGVIAAPRKESLKVSKQEIYRHVLQKTQEVLDDLKIPFFLSSGTCLGYARERNFIDHDYDIDIGISEKDWTPTLIDKMSAKGLYLYRILGSFDTGMELSFWERIGKGVGGKIDIFVHKDDVIPGKTCWYTFNKEKTKKLQYCVNKFEQESVDFLGLKVNVPDPIKEYLEEHYGKDWRIPKGIGILGGYSYDTSPLSLVN